MIKEFQKEYRWLSNFAPCKLFYEGLVYGSVETAYQAAKTDDSAERLHISTLTAGGAKRYSKTLDVRDDWDSLKLGVMKELLCKKFSQTNYARKLIETGDEHIQEGNYWGDKFWGVCLKTGEGENNLGKMIMDIRERSRLLRGGNSA